MKKVIKGWGYALVAIALAVLLTGCATSFPSGALYTELKMPVIATGNAAPATGLKVGTSTATSILSLVATGDASIEAAKKSAGITKVHHVDWSAKNFLGIWGEYKCTVYGE